MVRNHAPLMSNFRQHVLSVVAERTLQPKAEFQECAKDCPVMVALPTGTFLMGSPDEETGRERNEGPQQQITIDAAFAVSKTPVTFAQWDACVAVSGCPEISDNDGGELIVRSHCATLQAVDDTLVNILHNVGT